MARRSSESSEPPRARPYLSHSQMSLLERSEKAYYDRYFLGKPQRETPEMSLGTRLARAMETGEATGNPVIDLVAASLPRLDVPEMEIRTVLDIGGGPSGKIPLLCKLDSGASDLSAVEEYKTGRTKWSQKMVDADSQLTFYATAIWVQTRTLPALRLTWAEAAKGADGAPYLTGRVESFPTRRRLEQITQMMARMARAWATIGKMAAAYQLTLAK